MNIPHCINSNIWPERGNKIGFYSKESSSTVKIYASANISEKLFEYSEGYYYAANVVVDYILNLEYEDIGKLDSYFFAIGFLYRHSLELGLKAIAFQYITEKNDRISFIKTKFHNLYEIICELIKICEYKRPKDELDWLSNYLLSLSKLDMESDSFRYPFHIVFEYDEWELEKQYSIKRVFSEQTHIDLLAFANKFEAAYEIINKWYLRMDDNASEWRNYSSQFIEDGRAYYFQSVVGYKYIKDDFYPYTKGYLESANYLKWHMNNVTSDYERRDKLLFPMCYLYRNCVELLLKVILFEETGMNFQEKCKIAMRKKHSIVGLWNTIKKYILEVFTSESYRKEMDLIKDNCIQLQNYDNDANRFRYPMSKEMQMYFSQNRIFDYNVMGDFLEALNNSLNAVYDMIKDYYENVEY